MQSNKAILPFVLIVTGHDVTGLLTLERVQPILYIVTTGLNYHDKHGFVRFAPQTNILNLRAVLVIASAGF